MNQPRITFGDLAREPFRVFFPCAVLVGLAGVALWPLHFLGSAGSYPGQAHARLMAYGLFGGFMIGFLGTAMPRMLSANALNLGEVALLLAVYLTMSVAYAVSKIAAGDALLLLLLLIFLVCVGRRFAKRADNPPPGFVLVAMGLMCAAAGAILALLQHGRDEALALELFGGHSFVSGPMLQHLLSYQGFVLLPILGVGAFVLPRFFGLPNPHDFPESRALPGRWLRKASLAIMAGVLVIVSFVLEAAGWHRVGPALRFAATVVYVWMELPIFRRATTRNAFSFTLQTAFVLLLAGFVLTSIFPAYRISLMHLTLVGGFAVVTFTVATRVIFGHSGNARLLVAPNRWLLVSVGLLLLAMATRISGDFWPKIMASHYNYGALLWAAGVLLWAFKVLPKVLLRDEDDPSSQ